MRAVSKGGSGVHWVLGVGGRGHKHGWGGSTAIVCSLEERHMGDHVGEEEGGLH